MEKTTEEKTLRRRFSDEVRSAEELTEDDRTELLAMLYNDHKKNPEA